MFFSASKSQVSSNSLFSFVLCYAVMCCAVLCCMRNFKRKGLETLKEFWQLDNRARNFANLISFVLYWKK